MCAGCDLFCFSSDWLRKWWKHLRNCLRYSLEINESFFIGRTKWNFKETLVKYRVGLSPVGSQSAGAKDVHFFFF